MKKVLGAAILAGVMGGVYVLSAVQNERSKESSTPTRTAPPAAKPLGHNDQAEQIARALAQLASDQRDLRLRLDALDQVPPTVAEGDAPGASSLAVDNPQPADTSAELSADERFEFAAFTLDNHVLSEPLDPSWAKQAESSITDATRTLAGLSVERIACKSSLCKIEVGFTSLETREAGTRALAHAVPWETVAFYHATPEDPTHMVMYVAREGMTLPTPEG